MTGPAGGASHTCMSMTHTKERAMTQQIDDFIVSARETEFEMVDAGAYTLEVARIEAFEGKDFNTGEPKPGIKIVFKVVGGDWDGAEVDRVMSLPKNLANDRATLYAFFKGITGQIPEKGRNYALRKELTGKRCTGIVEHYQNAKGQTFARVQSVAPQGAGRRRPAPVAAPVIDEDGDDLADA